MSGSHIHSAQLWSLHAGKDSSVSQYVRLSVDRLLQRCAQRRRGNIGLCRTKKNISCDFIVWLFAYAVDVQCHGLLRMRLSALTVLILTQGVFLCVFGWTCGCLQKTESCLWVCLASNRLKKMYASCLLHSELQKSAQFSEDLTVPVKVSIIIIIIIIIIICFQLCLCIGFIIVTCAVKPARYYPLK